MNRHLHAFLIEDLGNNFYRFVVMNEMCRVIGTAITKPDLLTSSSVRQSIRHFELKKHRVISSITIHKEWNESLEHIIRNNIEYDGRFQSWCGHAKLGKVDFDDLKFFSGNNKISELLKKAFKSPSVHSLESKYQS